MISYPVETPQDESVLRYAQVALPVHLRKLFTYRLPESMQNSAQVGSRVVVQLGTKPTTGYIVALMHGLREGTSLVESEIKEVDKLLDDEPSLTPEVVEIARWVADYYAAPLGEVMRAALPAGINTSIMQVVSITSRGRETLESESVAPASTGRSAKADSKTKALQVLASEGEAELNAFCLRLGSARLPTWLRELERDGLIERSYRARTTATRAKRRRAVRLIESSIERYAGGPPAPPSDELKTEKAERPLRTARETDAQRRTIETLRANNGEMAVSDLAEAAKVSASVISTLKKKGLVTEFEQDVRRDPLARAELPETERYVLTDAQNAALRTI